MATQNGCMQRGFLMALVAATITSAQGCAHSPALADKDSIRRLCRIDHVALNVRNLETSAAFYQRVFGFEIVHQWQRTWMVGNERIRLGLFLRPEGPGVDADKAIVINHFAFLTDRDGFDEAIAALDRLGVPHDAPEDSGIAKSIFLKDPDGHNVEVTFYYAHIPAR